MLVNKEAKAAADVNIDATLFDRALADSGVRTNEAAVTIALREFIARRDQTGIGESAREAGRACLNDSDIETSAAHRHPGDHSCPGLRCDVFNLGPPGVPRCNQPGGIPPPPSATDLMHPGDESLARLRVDLSLDPTTDERSPPVSA
jgi:hypothetical protein